MKIFVVVLVAVFVTGCAATIKDPEIVKVAEYGNVSQLKILIDDGVNVNGKAFNGKTAVYAATEYRHADAVKLLIESGATNLDDYYTNLFSGESLTPLMITVKFNNPEIAKILLSAGADINAKNQWGDTALMAAANFKQVFMAKFLVESGADVNATKPNKTTALMIAARKGDVEMVDFLLDSGADVNIGLGTGDTALSLAVFKSKENHKQEWLEKCLNSYHQGKDCKIHPDLSLVGILLDNGAEINQVDKEGRTLLDRSIGDVGVEIPDLLIESGADVNQGDPLILAAYNGNSDLVDLLINKYNLDVNKRVKTKDKYTNDSTALHFAAIKGYEKALKVLLESGADVNAQSQNRDTALILAAMNGRLGTAKILIQAGADINVKNKDNYTALQFARKNRFVDMINLLLAAGAQ